jgi:acylphosphatase
VAGLFSQTFDLFYSTSAPSHQKASASSVQGLIMAALRFLLSGEVQGVKMRRYIEAAATFFHISGGFVINTSSGDVYGECSGSSEALNSFTLWLQGLPPRLQLSSSAFLPFSILSTLLSSSSLCYLVNIAVAVAVIVTHYQSSPLPSYSKGNGNQRHSAT